jgi:hypothetical protein
MKSAASSLGYTFLKTEQELAITLVMEGNDSTNRLQKEPVLRCLPYAGY